MAKHKRLKPIREYLYDKGEIIEQMFSSIPIVEVRNMVPIKLQGMPLHELKAECLVELLEMSDREILSILEGMKTRDLSSSESEAGGVVVISDDEKRIKKERRSDPHPAVVRKKDSDDSCTEQSTSIKKRNKRKSKEDDDQKGRKKKKVDSRQPVPSSSKDGQSSKEIPKKKKCAKPPDKPKPPAQEVVVLDDISSEESGNEGGKKAGEKSLLDLLELEMRARAIRSLLKKEEETQAKKVLSEYKDEPDDLIPVEVLPPQVDLLSDSDEDLMKEEQAAQPSTSSGVQVEVVGDTKDADVLETLLGIENKESSEVVDMIEVDALVDFVRVNPPDTVEVSCKDVGRKYSTTLNSKKEIEKLKSDPEPVEETDSHAIKNCNEDCDVTIKLERESSYEPKKRQKIEHHVVKATPTLAKSATVAKSCAKPGIGVHTLKPSASSQEEVVSSKELPLLLGKEQSGLLVRIGELSVVHPDYSVGKSTIATVVNNDKPMKEMQFSSTKGEIVVAANEVDLANNRKIISTSPKQFTLSSKTQKSLTPRNIENSLEEIDVLPSVSQLEDDKLVGRVSGGVEEGSNILGEISYSKSSGASLLIEPSVLPVECSKPQSVSAGEDCHSNFEEDILDYDYDPSLNNAERQSLHCVATGGSYPQSSPLRVPQADKIERVEDGDDFIQNGEESEIKHFDKSEAAESLQEEMVKLCSLDKELISTGVIQDSSLSLTENNLNTSNNDEKLSLTDNKISEHCGHLVDGSTIESETASHHSELSSDVINSISGEGHGPSGASKNIMLSPNANEEVALGILDSEDFDYIQPAEDGATSDAENELSSSDLCVGGHVANPSEEHHHFLVNDALGSPEAVSRISAIKSHEHNETEEKLDSIYEQVSGHYGHLVNVSIIETETASHHSGELSADMRNSILGGHGPAGGSNNIMPTPFANQEVELGVSGNIQPTELRISYQEKCEATLSIENDPSSSDQVGEHIANPSEEHDNLLVNDALSSPDAIPPRSTVKRREHNETDSSLVFQEGKMDVKASAHIDQDCHSRLSSMEENSRISDHESADLSDVQSIKKVTERQELHKSDEDCFSYESGSMQLEHAASKDVLVDKKQLEFLVNNAPGSPETLSPRTTMKSQEHNGTDSSLNSQQGQMDGEAVAHIDQDHHDKLSLEVEQRTPPDHESPDSSDVQSPKILIERQELYDSSVQENEHCLFVEGGTTQLEQGTSKDGLVGKEQLDFLVIDALGSSEAASPRSTMKSQECNETDSSMNGQQGQMDGEAAAHVYQDHLGKLSSQKKNSRPSDGDSLDSSDVQSPKIVAETRELHSNFSVEEKEHGFLEEGSTNESEQRGSKNILVDKEQLDFLVDDALDYSDTPSPTSPKSKILAEELEGSFPRAQEDHGSFDEDHIECETEDQHFLVREAPESLDAQEPETSSKSKILAEELEGSFPRAQEDHDSFNEEVYTERAAEDQHFLVREAPESLDAQEPETYPKSNILAEELDGSFQRALKDHESFDEKVHIECETEGQHFLVCEALDSSDEEEPETSSKSKILAEELEGSFPRAQEDHDSFNEEDRIERETEDQHLLVCEALDSLDEEEPDTSSKSKILAEELEGSFPRAQEDHDSFDEEDRIERETEDQHFLVCEALDSSDAEESKTSPKSNILAEELEGSFPRAKEDHDFFDEEVHTECDTEDQHFLVCEAPESLDAQEPETSPKSKILAEELDGSFQSAEEDHDSFDEEVHTERETEDQNFLVSEALDSLDAEESKTYPKSKVLAEELEGSFPSAQEDHDSFDEEPETSPKSKILAEELDGSFPRAQEDHDSFDEEAHIERKTEDQHFLVNEALDSLEAEEPETWAVNQKQNEFSSLDVEDDVFTESDTPVYSQIPRAHSEGEKRGDREPETPERCSDNEERMLANKAVVSLESGSEIINQELLHSKVDNKIVLLEDKDVTGPVLSNENTSKEVEKHVFLVHQALGSPYVTLLNTNVENQGQGGRSVAESNIQPCSDRETTAFVGCNSIETSKKIQITDGQAVRRTVGTYQEELSGKRFTHKLTGYTYIMDCVVVSSEDEAELDGVTGNKQHLDESMDCSFKNIPCMKNQLSPACGVTQLSSQCEPHKHSIHQDFPINQSSNFSCVFVISSDEHSCHGTEHIKESTSHHGDHCPDSAPFSETNASSLELTQPSLTVKERTDALGNRSNSSEVNEINKHVSGDSRGEEEQTSHETECCEETASRHGFSCPSSAPSSTTKASCIKPWKSSLIAEVRIDELGTGNDNSEGIEIYDEDLVGSSSEEEQTCHGTKCLEETTSRQGDICPLYAPSSTTKASRVKTDVLGNGNNNSQVIEIDDDDLGSSSSEEEQTPRGTKCFEETTSRQGDICPLYAPSSTTKASSVETDVLGNGNNNSQVIEIYEVSDETSSEEEQESDATSEDYHQSDEESCFTIHSISDDEDSVRTRPNQDVLCSSDMSEFETECITGEEVESSNEQLYTAISATSQSVIQRNLLPSSKRLLTTFTTTAYENIVDGVIVISDSEGEDNLQSDWLVKHVVACCDKELKYVMANNDDQTIMRACPSALPQNVDGNVSVDIPCNLNSEPITVSRDNDIHCLQMVNVLSTESNALEGNNTVDQPCKELALLEKVLEEEQIEESDSVVEISEDEGSPISKVLNPPETSVAHQVAQHYHKRSPLTTTDSENSDDSFYRRRGKKRLKLRKKRRKVIPEQGEIRSTKRNSGESKANKDSPAEPPTASRERVPQITSNVSKQTSGRMADCDTIVIEDDDKEIVQAITEQMPPEILELDDSDKTKTNWTARWLESSHVKKVVTTSKILTNARKKLKMKLKVKEIPETEAAPSLVEVPQLIGSVEEYHRLVKEGVITSSSKPIVDTGLEKVDAAGNSEASPNIYVPHDATTDKRSDDNVGRANSSEEVPVKTLENESACDTVIPVDQPEEKLATLDKELEEGEIEESDSVVQISSSDPVSLVAPVNRPTTQPVLNVESTLLVTKDSEAVVKDSVLNRSSESNMKGTTKKAEDYGKCRDPLSLEASSDRESRIEVSNPQLPVNETSILEENENKSSGPMNTDPLSSSIKTFYEMLNLNQVVGIDSSSKLSIPFPPLVSDKNVRKCNSSVSIQLSVSPSAECSTIASVAGSDDVGSTNQSIDPLHMTCGTTEVNTTNALESKKVSAACGLVPQLTSEKELEEGEIEGSDDEIATAGLVEISNCATTAVDIQNTVCMSNNNAADTSSPIVHPSAAISTTTSVGNTNLECSCGQIPTRPSGSTSSSVECNSSSISPIVPAANVTEPDQHTPASVVQSVTPENSSVGPLPGVPSSFSQIIGQPTAIVQCYNTPGSSSTVHSTHSVSTVSHSTLASVIPPSYAIPEGQTTPLMLNSAVQKPAFSGIHAALPPMNPIQAATAEINNLYQYGRPPGGLGHPQMSVNINSTLQMYDPYYSWVYSQGLSGSLNSSYGYGAPDPSQGAGAIYKQWGEYYRKLMEACQDSAARASASNMFGPNPPNSVDSNRYSWVFERPNQASSMNNPETSNIVPNYVEPVQSQGPGREWNYRYGLKGLLNEHFVTPGAAPTPSAPSNPQEGGLSRRRSSRRGKRKKKR